MRKSEVFFLAPPLIGRKDYGFAVIQLGADYSGTLLLRLKDWGALDYMRFWQRELSEVANGRRKVGLLPEWVYRHASGSVYVGERMEFSCSDGIFVFRERAVVTKEDSCRSSWRVLPKQWWRFVEDDFEDIKNRDVLTWKVEAQAVREWCRTYALLFSKMEPLHGKP